MSEVETFSNGQITDNDVLLFENFIKKYQWLYAQLEENQLPKDITAEIFQNGVIIDGLQLQLDKFGLLRLSVFNFNKFKSSRVLYNIIQNCDIYSETEQMIIIDFKDDIKSCAHILCTLTKLRKADFNISNATFIISTSIKIEDFYYYKIRFDVNMNYTDPKLSDDNIIEHIRIAYNQPVERPVIKQNNTSVFTNNNIDWNKIIFIPILLLGIIYPMLWKNVGGLEDFMKEVATEYNAPLSEVKNEILSAIRSEDSWFPLPNTIWYVTKDNGEDVTVGRSDVFGTDVYKDKLDNFFHLEFWRGRKSLEEMQMDAIREQMGRK